MEERSSNRACCHSTINNEESVKGISGARLLFALALNLIIPVTQVLGGMYAHSVALISDAAHNFSDFAALLIAYFAFLIGKRGPSSRNTFGYRRAEVLAVLINVGILFGACAFIIYEAVQRFHHPASISGRVVMLLAGVGILGNGLSVLFLRRDAKHSLNIRGAMLHLIGDLLTSVAVLVNGLILTFKPWYWLDPALSLLIALFILRNCWALIKEATIILMNATPKGLDICEVKECLEKMPEVCEVHYLHAWNVSSSSIAFSCHVVVVDQLLSKAERLGDKIRKELLDHFGIDHPVLQFETGTCGTGGLLCEMTCNGGKNG